MDNILRLPQRQQSTVDFHFHVYEIHSRKPRKMFPPRRCINSVVRNINASIFCRGDYVAVRFVSSNSIGGGGGGRAPRTFTTNNHLSKFIVVDKGMTTTKNHYFSTSGTEDGAPTRQSSYQVLLQHLTHSTRSLGVWEGIDSLHTTTATTSLWESIHELPEIKAVSSALQQILEIDPSLSSSTLIIHRQYQTAITALERAIQIFGSYRPGGKEQMASYALLVEFQNRSNQYDACRATLNELLAVYKSNNDESEAVYMNDIVQIATAKVLWYQGHHAAAKEICDALVEENRPVSVVARTGQAMTRLLLVTTLDDVFSVRDPFRMSIRRLEQMVHPSATVLAAAYLNMGIAEMVWAETVSKFNDVDAPLDAAMRNWKQGITILTRGELAGSNIYNATKLRKGQTKDSPLRSMLHARLLCNMAYGMLHMNHHADYVSQALEYASESLAIYDAMNKHNNDTNKASDESGEASGRINYDKEGLGRALSVAGTCFHLNGTAVPAQGLFQSSLDKISVNFSTLSTRATPLQLVEQSDTYERYSDLCLDWEEREGDAKQLREKANDIHAKLLPDGWKDKTSIHGSLWFWTGATMQRH